MTDFTFLKSKTTGAIKRNHCGPKSTIFHRAQPRKHPFLLLINPQDTLVLFLFATQKSTSLSQNCWTNRSSFIIGMKREKKRAIHAHQQRCSKKSISSSDSLNEFTTPRSIMDRSIKTSTWCLWQNVVSEEIDSFLSTLLNQLCPCEWGTSFQQWLILWHLTTSTSADEAIKLTFRLNPLIFDTELLPIFRRIVLRVVVGVREVDDETEFWKVVDNVARSMPMSTGMKQG